MTPLLFLDPGATTGWAARDEAGAIHFGHARLGLTRAGAGARVNALAGFLSEWQSRFLPAELGYELPFHSKEKPEAAPPLYHYEGCILAHCDRLNLPVRGVLIQHVKQAFGRGTLVKADMIRIATMQGFAVTCDHEADALGGLHWMIGVHAQMALGLAGGRLRRKVTR